MVFFAEKVKSVAYDVTKMEHEENGKNIFSRHGLERLQSVCKNE